MMLIKCLFSLYIIHVSSAAIPCSSKKGLVYNGGSYCQDAVASNSPHFVNFSPLPGVCHNVTKIHYPTLLHVADIATLEKYLSTLPKNEIPEWVMGFNEPNYAYGGDTRNILTPDQAAIEWKKVIDLKYKFGFKLTSPSPTGVNTGHGPERFEWYRLWFESCKKHGLDCLASIDAFGVHCYAGWGEFVDVPKKLIALYNKPTFYSEICVGNNAGVQKQIDFMTKIYTEGEHIKEIVKMFWNTAEPIPGDANVNGAEIFTKHTGPNDSGKTGQLTKLGALFKSIQNC